MSKVIFSWGIRPCNGIATLCVLIFLTLNLSENGETFGIVRKLLFMNHKASKLRSFEGDDKWYVLLAGFIVTKVKIQAMRLHNLYFE